MRKTDRAFNTHLTDWNAAGNDGVSYLFSTLNSFGVSAVCVIVLVLAGICIAVMAEVFSVQAASVSDNEYSETVIDEEAGDTLTEDGHVVNAAEAAAQLEEEIQTNEIDGWPEGPAVTAASAILMDADTGTILYAKDINEKMYPASTTKLLTCLIAVEYLDLNDTITFSESAIAAVPADGSNIGMSVGESITVEQCLYGLMVGSGNECANALAEAVSGSIDEFVVLMNEYAVMLGCSGTHFVNANGLHDDEHYTTAYDLALIAQAFFANETCRTIGNTASYQFTATETQPDEFTLTNKHELITGEVSYSGIIGGKTGYTSQAHENLVTGCEQNGMTLICVVMHEDDPAQFDDTVTLFDYGYSNFSTVDAQEYAVLPGADISGYLTQGMDLLGISSAALAITEGGKITIPDGTGYDDLTMVYDSDNIITYYYGYEGQEGTEVGSAVLISYAETENAQKSTAASMFAEEEGERGLLARFLSFYISEGLNGAVYVNIAAFLFTITVFIFGLTLYLRIHDAMSETRERARQRRRRAKRAHVERRDYYENRRYDRTDEYYGEPDYISDYRNADYYRDEFPETDWGEESPDDR